VRAKAAPKGAGVAQASGKMTAPEMAEAAAVKSSSAMRTDRCGKVYGDGKDEQCYGELFHLLPSSVFAVDEGSYLGRQQIVPLLGPSCQELLLS